MSWRDVYLTGWGKPCTQTLTRVPMFSLWDRVKQRRFRGAYIYVAKGAAPCFRFLRRQFKKSAPHYYKHIDDFADDWGQACRPIAGTDIPSKHAYGLAADVDATKNYQGLTYTSSPIWKYAREVVLAWEAIGNAWGGRFSNPDPMHFEVRLTPAQIRAKLKKNGKRK